MIPALDALARLRQGNERFVHHPEQCRHPIDGARRDALTEGQNPFAIVLGCSDSRVPAELVFDVGLGDLFVIRVAGNIVAPSQIGSVEFAAEAFKTRLVVVLGHSQCGAVKATLDELEDPSEVQMPNLHAIIDRITPAVQPLVETSRGLEDETRLAHAVRANIRASANHLRQGSPLLERLIRDEGLLIVGAEYALDTGVVNVFDGLPGTTA